MAIDWNKIKSNAQGKDTAQYNAMKADKEKVVSAGGSFSTYSPDYEKRQSELAEQRRQAQVDLDIDTINRIDAELKTLRANAGKQTSADRIGDVVGASASGTVGNVANAAGTLFDLLNGNAQSKTVNNLYNFADTAAKDTERFTKDAKQNLGKVGQFAVDAGVAGGQLLTDMAASALVPGAGLALMGARGFGGGAQEARQEGATLGQQVAYGAGTAAVSVLSEKLFNVAGPYAKTFGKGFFDKVASKLTGSAVGRVIASALTEGAEEGLESVLQPVLKNLTYTDGEKVDWSEVAYEALIGAALGGLGGGADIAATQGTRNSAKQGSATVPVVSEGSNAPKTNVAQNAPKSDSGGIAERINNRADELYNSLTDLKRGHRKVVNGYSVGMYTRNGSDSITISIKKPNGEIVKYFVENGKYSTNEQLRYEIARKVAEIEAETNNDGLGAANLGFDPYTNAQNKYGTLPSGENPVRSDDVPVSVDGETNVSQSVVTAKGAKVTPDAFVPLLENETMKNGYSFVPITNDQSVQAAEQEIMYKGWDQARADWTANVRAGKAGDQITAMGALLYNNAVNAGNYKAALDIFADYQQAVRNSARGLQAARILKSMTPDSRLYLMQRSIQNMVDSMGLKEPIVVPDELLDAYKNAKTDADNDAAVNAIQKYVAKNIPSTLLDMWKALRYTNMLGNFKTQGRNIIGNVAMRAVSEMQNAVATFFETATKGKYGKTRSVFVSDGLRKAAKADFDKIKTQVLGEDKYTFGNETADAFAAGVNEKREIFKIGDEHKVINALLKPVELYRKGTNWMMNNQYFGDTAFLKSAYTRYLSGYLQANKITAEQFNDPNWQKKNRNFVDKARQFAIQQAQEVTFRDSNTLSDWVSSLGRKPSTPAAVKAVSEGALPFRRTPANVLVRAEEYSPLGLINTAVEAAKAQKGTASGTDVINALSKSLTGTGIFLTGMMLAASGMLRGGGTDDEKQDAFDELAGHQNYSLVLPDGTSITLDWLSPASMPLFMGAEFERLREEGGWQLKDLEASLTSLAEPMVQMSMLQGVNDTLNDLQYAQNNNFGQIAATLALNYLTQGLTNSLVGQISRSTKEDSMMTYVDKNSPLPDWLQREIGAASRKYPGDGFQQIPYIDAWGRTESTGDPLERAANNLFNPAYMSEVDVDNVEKELQRVYDAVGTEYGSVFPDRADKSFDVNGKPKNLTAEQYVKYAKAKGENSYKFVQQAINSSAYKKMRNSEKAEFIADMYAYANYKAKKAVVPIYKNDTYDKYAEAEKQGISPAEYAAYRFATNDMEADKDKDGKSISGSKKEKVVDYINGLNMTPTEKDWLYLLNYKSDNDRTNWKNLRQLPWNS